jgi:hypothetical protein
VSDDNGGFNWNLTPRKPDPEPDTEPQAEEKPAVVPPPLPTAPLYPPPQQFRPPSQYPQATPPPPLIRPHVQKQPPVPSWDEPTQAMQRPSTADLTQQPVTPPAWFQPQQPTSAIPPVEQPTTAIPPVEQPTQALKTESSEIDDIFGAHAFQEYDDGPLIGQIPLARTPKQPQQPKAPAPPISRTQKILLSVAGGLIAALALVAIYVAGTHIDLGGSDEPAAVVSPTATPAPEETVAAGPVAPGDYEWNELQGTECLEPFENAWQETYTVVDCAIPHAAQLTAKGTFDEADVFPGPEALATEANLACASTKVINYKKASVYDDVAISASYATTDQEWTDGFHDYYCFVNLTSGDPITGTISRAFGTAEG